MDGTAEMLIRSVKPVFLLVSGLYFDDSVEP